MYKPLVAWVSRKKINANKNAKNRKKKIAITSSKKTEKFMRKKYKKKIVCVP